MLFLGITLIGLIAFTDALATPRTARPPVDSHDEAEQPFASLAELALQKVMTDASPIFGQHGEIEAGTSTWSEFRLG